MPKKVYNAEFKRSAIALGGVARAAFYAWLNDPARSRRRYREQLGTKIEQIRQEPFMSTYGSPRMTKELLARDTLVSRNTAARVMKEAGLQADSGTRFVPCTTDSRHDHPVADNTLDRDFAASVPNQK